MRARFFARGFSGARAPHRAATMAGQQQQQRQQQQAAAALPSPPAIVTTVPAAHRALTKYERAKVIGVRAEQLARGAQCFVDADASGAPFDAHELAERELAARAIPFVVVRHMPDGSTQHLRIEDAFV